MTNDAAADGGSATEREIKIPVADLDAVRRRLQAAGAELRRPAAFEENLVFDFQCGPRKGRLRSRRELLRLRADGEGAKLTFKSPPRFAGSVKERLEHQFSLDDGDAARRLLESLGFEVAVRYEKVRERWLLLGCEVALDQTPMGAFVEVEELVEAKAPDGAAPPDRIAEVCQRCGLDAALAVRESYLALYRSHRRERPELPADMVFEQRPAPGSSGGTSSVDAQSGAAPSSDTG